MGNNLRFHNGHSTQTTAIVMYSVLVDADVTLTISGGTAVDSGRSERRNSGGVTIYTGSFSITGLSPGNDYSYTISQGAESYEGSVPTLVSSGSFSKIFCACTNYKYRGPTAYREMRRRIETSEHPFMGIDHIDDVTYVDTLEAGGSSNGNFSTPSVITGMTGEPEATGLAADYASAWAVFHGHEPAYGPFYESNFQWCLRNTSWRMSGGDHAVANNHRRGISGNSDYTWVDSTHEATALAEWAAFIGDGNPDTLGSAGDLYWGYDIGNVRFAIMDALKTGDPRNTDPTDGSSAPENSAEAKETHPLFGQTQISNVMTYLDVATPQFKCLMLPTGFSVAGQPWAEWWIDEADDWHATHLVGDNLDGTSGWFFGLIGDNHTLHATFLDSGTGTGFCYFCPGTTGNSGVTTISTGASNGASIGTKTGRTRYLKASDAGGTNDDKHLAAFLFVTYHDEAIPRINVKAIEASGNVAYEYNLTAVSGNDNQFVDTRSVNFSAV